MCFGRYGVRLVLCWFLFLRFNIPPTFDVSCPEVLNVLCFLISPFCATHVSSILQDSERVPAELALVFYCAGHHARPEGVEVRFSTSAIGWWGCLDRVRTRTSVLPTSVLQYRLERRRSTKSVRRYSGRG